MIQKEKLFTVKHDVICGLVIYYLYYFEVHFVICWQFYHERVLNFVVFFFWVFWYNHMIFMLDFANVVYIDLALSRFCSVKTSTKVDFKLLAVYWLAYKLPETLVVSCCESVWDCWSTPTHPRMELLLKRWGAEAGSREPSALFVWYTVTLDQSSWIGV